MSLVVGALFCMPGPAEAQTYWHRLCLDELEIPDFWDRIIPGCEVIDCCPGCPGPGELEWRIQLGGDPVAQVSLDLEGLKGPLAERLRLGDRPAGKLAGRKLVLQAGETTLLGVPGKFDGPPPAVTPSIEWDRGQIERLVSSKSASRDSKGDNDAPVAVLKLSVDQVLESIVVNEYQLVIELWPCRGSSHEACDHVVLHNNTASDSVVVLVDGHRSNGCANDEIWRGPDDICVNNLLTNGSCNTETAVLSDDNAMALVSPTTVWTNATGDVLNVDLQPRLDAPVDVWLLDPNAAARAITDVINASLLYNTNHAGIRFIPTVIDESLNQTAINLVGTNNSVMCAAGWRNALTSSAFFTPGRLNVYYVDGAFTGLNCTAVRNIIVVGTSANNQSLAHEFGHAFTLDHTNGVAGFGANNVMVGGGANRDHFSQGQAFRMNVNSASMLNVNGVRTGVTRTCPDTTTSATCPPIALDSLPH